MAASSLFTYFTTPQEKETTLFFGSRRSWRGWPRSLSYLLLLLSPTSVSTVIDCFRRFGLPNARHAILSGTTFLRLKQSRGNRSRWNWPTAGAYWATCFTTRMLRKMHRCISLRLHGLTRLATPLRFRAPVFC